MALFKDFKIAVNDQFTKMAKEQLFYVDLDKDELYRIYLDSFPDGANPIFKERSEHDCNACKSFIRGIGNAVIVKGNSQICSIWDIEIDEPYNTVCGKMSEYVKSKTLKGIYSYFQSHVGVDKNAVVREDGGTATFEHLHVVLPWAYVAGKDVGSSSRLSERNAALEVFYSGLKQIDLDSIDVVADLISQGSLYRGSEFSEMVKKFRVWKAKFDKVDHSLQRNFAYRNACGDAVHIAKIKNTVIGTLLLDIAEGKELERAVASYESKVAPMNYKRPTALVTKGMIEQAQKTIVDLGLLSALDRRYALAEDLSVDDVLFVDRSIKKKMDVFDDLIDDASKKAPKKSFDKVEEINIEDFIAKVLPKADKVELMVENSMSGNFVSLVAPVDRSAKNMFKWDNNFSWSYNGEVTDSIKERVKKAGGKVDGFIRCSLSWYNYDDLDLHAYEPGGTHIYFREKRSMITYGNLDVDMNAGGGNSRSAVENIVWPDKKRLKTGTYEIKVNNFNQRERVDVGFEVEFECNGEIHNFAYDKMVVNKQYIQVLQFKYDAKTEKVEVIPILSNKKASKEIWGITTNTFVPVNMIALSPNYWGDNAIGNKHYMFMLDGCKNPEGTRGFYNEYLDNDLNKHRKVFEMLASKMKVEHSDNQLSGLGFSSTQKNSVVVRVSGSFNRIIKINF